MQESQCKEVEVLTTQGFDECVELTLAHYTDNNVDLVDAIDKVEEEREFFTSKVLEHPELYAICPELIEFGITNIRHYVRNGIRILYEVSEEKEKIVVTAIAILGTRQSITKQLIDLCVFRH